MINTFKKWLVSLWSPADRPLLPVVWVSLVEDQYIVGRLAAYDTSGIMICQSRIGSTAPVIGLGPALSPGVSKASVQPPEVLPGSGKVFVPMHRVTLVQYLPNETTLDNDDDGRKA